MPSRSFRLLAAATSLLASAAVSPASAQTVNEDWSVYVRAGAGAAFPNRLDQDLAYDPRSTFAVAPPSRRVSDFEMSASPSVALGFAYPAGTRTELEYRFLQPGFDGLAEFGAAGSPGPVAVVPADDFTAHFLLSNAYYEVVRAGGAAVFVGAGVGGGFFENGLGQRDAAFAYQGRGGVTFDVSKRVTLQVEYVYLRTRDVVFGPDRLGRGPVGGVQALGEPFVMSAADASVILRF